MFDPNSTIIQYISWMIMGAMQVLIIQGGMAWARERNIDVNWWKAGLVYLWFASLVVTVAGGFTLYGELEGNAGWYFIGVLGVGQFIAGLAMIKLLLFRKTQPEVLQGQ
jgi:hypothetical protein